MTTSDRTARIVAKSLVKNRVAGMLEALEAMYPGAASRLRLDAIAEIESWTGVRLIVTETTDGQCSVSGGFVSNDAGSTIVVSEALSPRRTAFTAIHEVGHLIQQTDLALAEELLEQSDGGFVLEELACNSFAAAVLLPQDLREATLGGGIPTVGEVLKLWRSASASRAAVCVCVAEQLTSPGHVLLLDDAGHVVFCASHAAFPLRVGSDQSASGIWSAFRRNLSGTATAEDVRFAYRDGYQGEAMYAQATSMDGLTLVLAATDGVPWRRLALSSRDAPVLAQWHTCLGCEAVFAASMTSRCVVCNDLTCPDCGYCACKERLQTRVCGTCWMVKPAHMFAAGSDECSDCVG